MRIPISAIIPTLNEERDIAEAIDSVAWCDEVIVMDSFSTDKTVDIARDKGVKVIQHAFDGYVPQKNRAMLGASHDTILLLDADERVTQELQDEIVGILSKGELPYKGYWIKRQNYFMGRQLKYLWKSDKVMRFVDRRHCHYPPALVHEEMTCDGPAGLLSQRLLHDTYQTRGLKAHLAKGDHYTTLAARERAGKMGRVGLYHLALKPLFTFIKHYFIKLGILDGQPGFVISSLSAWNVFQRYLKVWRIHEGEDI